MKKRWIGDQLARHSLNNQVLKLSTALDPQRNLFLAVTVAGITDLAGGPPSLTPSASFRHSVQRSSSTIYPPESKLIRCGFQGSILLPHSKQNFGNIGLLLLNRLLEKKEQCNPTPPIHKCLGLLINAKFQSSNVP